MSTPSVMRPRPPGVNLYLLTALIVGIAPSLLVACAAPAEGASESTSPSGVAATEGGEAAKAQPEEGAVAEEDSASGLDARLTGFEYPYPMRVHRFAAQGMSLEMAYMDVAAEDGAEHVAERPTVLLMHGKNFSGAYWADTMAALVAQGYRVIVPDQIGFGKSSKPADFQWSFHGMASHTLGLLDELQVQQVAVVGHSMGGMLATRFALMFPDRVTGLALVNPIGLEDWKRVVPYASVT